MARPSKFDRNEAIETAMNEIWRSGYEAASVKALSETLGITRSSFYNAFGSREELLGEVLKRYFAQSPDRALSEAGPETPVRRLLTQLFRAICHARASDPEHRGCLAINLITELCPAESPLACELAQALPQSAARFEQLLRWGMERGELPPGTDPQAQALALQALMVGLNVMSKTITDETRLWLTAKTTLRGLGLYEETQDA